MKSKTTSGRVYRNGKLSHFETRTRYSDGCEHVTRRRPAPGLFGSVPGPRYADNWYRRGK